MNAPTPDAGPALSAMLNAARVRTLLLVEDYTPPRWLGPRLATVNPPLWEVGHLGWFQERWCLRHGDSRQGSLLDQADELYDSAQVPHAVRWDLPLPDVATTLGYLATVQSAVLTRLERESNNPDLQYFARLCAFHEEMHCEAMTYTRQTLGYPAPQQPTLRSGTTSTCTGDVEISGGPFQLGAADDDSFVFDNEKWAHAVDVKPFRMARTAVTNAQFAEFVDAGGYQNRCWWDRAGWEWRTGASATAPLYWRHDGSCWQQRYFDQEEVLQEELPVLHINWYEATAWCRWARRRLPTEAEWEFAAATGPGHPELKRRYPWGEAAPDVATANLYGAAGRCVPVGAFAAGDSAWGVRQMLGNVWEWTADWFQPYPGFVRDPYAEYSAPWFGNHKVLRGGCHATRGSLIRNTWRNFYTPDRRDVYAGFRTCAL